MISFKDGSRRNNDIKTVIGYDLGRDFAQISFYKLGESEPTTVSTVMGTETYNIPLVLSKRQRVGQWFYGRDALKCRVDESIRVDDLLMKAISGEDVIIEDAAYDPVALLVLFIKRSLGLLTMHMSLKDVDAYMFTLEELTPRAVEVLGKVAASLDIDNEKVCYASHLECFYHYMIHQPRELWQYQVAVFEYNTYLKAMRFESSHNTKPEIVLIHQYEFEDFKRIEWDEDENIKDSQQEELDERFSEILTEVLSEGEITTAYLIGEGYKEPWAKDSLKILCKNRRVFQGNNLFSKGACYAMMDKIEPSVEVKNHVYLGEDKLKSNIGMNVLRKGAESYFAILDAGLSWYDSSREFDIILDEGNELSFVIISLTGGNVIEKPVVLEGLPKRPRGTTRLSVSVKMQDVNNLEAVIADKGFGEIIKSSGLSWTFMISID